MKIVYRYNSEISRHYLLEKHYTFKFKPKIAYAGILEKSQNWREEPHSHEYLELIFVCDGKGTVTVKDKTVAFKKGDLIVHNAGDVHYEISDPDDPMELLCVAYDRLEIDGLPKNWLIPPERDRCFSTGELYPLFKERFDIIVREFVNKDPFYADIAQNESRALLMYFFRLLQQADNTASLLGKSKILELATSYIDTHYQEQISLDELAEICHTNKYYLSHSFSREYSMSIGKYILDKRLAKAKELLKNTTLSIKEVGEQVGFQDSGYFCRVFKKTCGTTPNEYRQK